MHPKTGGSIPVEIASGAGGTDKETEGALTESEMMGLGNGEVLMMGGRWFVRVMAVGTVVALLAVFVSWLRRRTNALVDCVND